MSFTPTNREKEKGGGKKEMKQTRFLGHLSGGKKIKEEKENNEGSPGPCRPSGEEK